MQHVGEGRTGARQLFGTLVVIPQEEAGLKAVEPNAGSPDSLAVGRRQPVPLHPATISAMAGAATAGSSCSQTRITCQPADLRRSSVSRSRTTLVDSFFFHHSAFALGELPCSGQPCQKQPSTNTATLARENTMSALRRKDGSGRTSTLYRSPRACRRRLIANSAGVSRVGVFCIRRVTDSLDGIGSPSTLSTVVALSASSHRPAGSRCSMTSQAPTRRPRQVRPQVGSRRGPPR